MAIDYHLLAAQAHALVANEPDWIANAANLSALLFQVLPDVNFAGFYRYENSELILGPFQGRPACVHIALDHGVCGIAAQTRQPLLVPDVHAFAGHIACDQASRSELVLLILRDHHLLGVLDLDSPKPARFSQSDQQELMAVLRAVGAD
ncbi:MAG: GAF domain-containing protein [Lactobacillus sp.]